MMFLFYLFSIFFVYLYPFVFYLFMLAYNRHLYC